MPFIGNQPTAVPLTGADLTDGIITPAKLSTTLDLSSKTLTLPSGVGGKVLQVVQSSTTTQVVNTTSTYSDTTLTASITPSSSSNKILILICQSIQWYSTSAGGSAKWQLLRDATVIYEPTPTAETLFSYDYGGSGLNLYFNNPLDYLDTPSTTSSVTYKTRIAIGAYGGNQANAQYNNNKSFITLMEIAG